MSRFINNLLLYFQFLTRVPINKELECTPNNFRQGTIFFPLIGLFLGGMEYLVYFLTKNIFPSSVSAATIVIIPIILTGGLHVDGLGDTCDGFFAFKGGKEKIIEIMKDSRVGTYASIAVVCDILLKYTLIKSSIELGMPEIIVAGPILARVGVIFIAFIGKQAKEKGSGNIFIGNIDLKMLILTFIIAMGLCLWLVGAIETVTSVGVIIVFDLLFNKLCQNKINGHTGDTLGAVSELGEIIAMMTLIAAMI